jgi:hypothetical protein
MADSDDLARYLAEQTQLPVEEVTEIYRAGVPWPILFKELARLAQQDAHAAGVSVETAAKAIDQLCNLEGAHLKALVKTAEQAVARVGSVVPFFDMPEVQAVTNHFIMRDLLQYSERVALRVGESESWKVFAIYLALLDYAQEHPDWAG